MSRVRTSRTRLAGVTTLALAALLLTACNNDSDKDGKPAAAPAATTSPSAPAATAPATTPATSAPTGPPSSRPASSNTKPSSAAGKDSSGGTDPGSGVTCEGSNTKTVAAPLNRPINHVLLTVTNTGSKTCFLYHYPALRFGGAQSVPPVIEESKPQAVVTLKPGESGYASVNLSTADGSGGTGNTEKSLTVYFHGPSGTESVGSGATPSLPAQGLFVDDSLKTTYWQQSMDDATSW
ncbi:hypothetical protein B4N89_12310 [Embleya scabrispora]|uniref:DUF4232 domain-containing protein n=1 Tax=Embleya scabrispora TaxID=159449 RepID=A0A1T3NXY5_9ACTN|nr:DUF4232 domain-containing protein [Embleya scabrispora]OPC81624.1 hypothetical protein B4N89_12310 [Embleya scabrispora]